MGPAQCTKISGRPLLFSALAPADATSTAGTPEFRFCCPCFSERSRSASSEGVFLDVGDAEGEDDFGKLDDSDTNLIHDTSPLLGMHRRRAAAGGLRAEVGTMGHRCESTRRPHPLSRHLTQRRSAWSVRASNSPGSTSPLTRERPSLLPHRISKAVRGLARGQDPHLREVRGS